jgi:hypothetical protein
VNLAEPASSLISMFSNVNIGLATLSDRQLQAKFTISITVSGMSSDDEGKIAKGLM